MVISAILRGSVKYFPTLICDARDTSLEPRPRLFNQRSVTGREFLVHQFGSGTRFFAEMRIPYSLNKRGNKCVLRM